MKSLNYKYVHKRIFYLLLSTNEDRAATFQNPFGGSLHDKQMARVAGVVTLMDRDLVLIGGVEWNLGSLLVALPDRQHIAKSQFHTLQQSSFRSITGDFLLQNWDTILTTLELGSVAKSSDFSESFESGAGAV